MKNLLNPTPSQKKWRNRQWAKALLNSRKCRERLGDGKGSYCCLGVAQKLANSFGVKGKESLDSGAPHKDVYKFFGWGYSICLNIEIDGKVKKISAVGLNDGSYYFKSEQFKSKGLPHNKISELVLNTFVHPEKPKKQSFKA